MKKLKPCPYCGSPAEDTAENYCSCSNSECPSDCVIMSIEQWNHRPTEQAAEERANAAESFLEGLTPGGSEFHGNPTMCAQWVADRLSTMAKLVLQRKAAEQQVAEAERIIEVALEERYQDEVVDTGMEDLDIGEDGYYADKSDWLDSRLDEWKQVATIDTAEGKE